MHQRNRAGTALRAILTLPAVLFDFRRHSCASRRPIAFTVWQGRRSVYLMRSKLIRALSSSAIALVLLGFVSTAAHAATQAGYPTASVQFGASTRTLPYVRPNTYWGYALRNPGTSSGNQTASVACWYDGDWTTGNYYTNRWFKVLTWESYDGYNTPRWLFVHASYVYNQPGVRQCYATSTGIW
jgi:hypothetical protein